MSPTPKGIESTVAPFHSQRNAFQSVQFTDWNCWIRTLEPTRWNLSRIASVHLTIESWRTKRIWIWSIHDLTHLNQAICNSKRSGWYGINSPRILILFDSSIGIFIAVTVEYRPIWQRGAIVFLIKCTFCIDSYRLQHTQEEKSIPSWDKKKERRDKGNIERGQKKKKKTDGNRLNNSTEQLIGLAVCNVAISKQIQLKHATGIIETRHRPIRSFQWGPPRRFHFEFMN